MLPEPSPERRSCSAGGRSWTPIALAVLGVLVYAKRIPEPLVILAAGAVGLLLKGAA